MLGVLVGTLVEVDEGTVSKEVLEYSRLRMRIPLGKEVRLVKKRFPLFLNLGIRLTSGARLWRKNLRPS